ncbi:Primosome PriB/single-strand DNA-binding family and Single-strand DNA-binding family and Nucleic acid-binding, OB-fold domain-containing protein [Strongyloides ratti]|uniref:Primosome PriB/single-strand DNA-binding family and Single-strand DNA-binding family and Nucleic acid-binding, OB-fold domain-containing protein n=1 Tax=Strongyloides ratti TaxID=34506 RepID=A0A090LE13_STRRB|nr:Primosome PriB/single-strand DNA-binding family and Single-strand DNA-binding family and Nucleic acid-binding, OB-fold domain-containing protein [Strongyloides ratti]CEF65710.1 Primosome PriB/single-strand DNA-binding family and Single-strand DNA-binding family and Nucleic acid-binding, OB-fold domain-containing protein [Strongyloides ratti]
MISGRVRSLLFAGSMVKNLRPLSMTIAKFSEESFAKPNNDGIDDLLNRNNKEYKSSDTRPKKSFSVNRVELIGGVSKDPVQRLTYANKEFSVFTLATNKVVKDRETGGEKDVVDYHEILAFGKNSLFVKDRVKKGDRIFLTGKLSYNHRFSDSGDKISKAVIIADIISQFSSRRNN